MVAHTFNPSTWESLAFNPNTREVKIRRDTAGGERRIRREETELKAFHLGFIVTGSCPLQSDSDRGKRSLQWLAPLLL